jgi:hypothetical protein
LPSQGIHTALEISVSHSFPLVPGLLPSEISRASSRHNTATALSSHPTRTLVAYRLPFQAIPYLLDSKMANSSLRARQDGYCEKLHAEGNLHPAPLFCTREVRGPEACEMKDSA